MQEKEMLSPPLFSVYNVPEHGFSLYKLHRKIWIRENLYFRIIYAVISLLPQKHPLNSQTEPKFVMLWLISQLYWAVQKNIGIFDTEKKNKMTWINLTGIN